MEEYGGKNDTRHRLNRLGRRVTPDPRWIAKIINNWRIRDMENDIECETVTGIESSFGCLEKSRPHCKNDLPVVSQVNEQFQEALKYRTYCLGMSSLMMMTKYLKALINWLSAYQYRGTINYRLHLSLSYIIFPIKHQNLLWVPSTMRKRSFT